jgi:GTPase SAR1 family protein
MRHRNIKDLLNSREGRLSRQELNKVVPMTPEKIFISTDSSNDYIQNEFLLKRYEQGLNTHTKTFNLDMVNRIAWDEFIQSLCDEYFVNMQKNRGLVMQRDRGFFTYATNYENTSLTIVGDKDWVEVQEALIFSKFESIRCTIEWYYTSDGESVTIKVANDMLPCSEMYPWMKTPLETYYQNFMNSNASILLLLGPPGTGKTSWIKGLLYETKNNGIVTYDPEILKRDYVFANFISGEANVMVIEDADVFLKSREGHGNDLMHKFLNIGSGLISSAKKKIIFSTNLANIRDVDEALVRPGRCYDILEFRNLKVHEAEALARAKGLDFDPSVCNNDTVSVAEVFNQKTNQEIKKFNRSVGFI